MTPESNSKLSLWISRVAVAVSIVALVAVSPLCHCPRYYVILSATGLIPLLCGPRLYRWLGGAFVVAALAFALGEHRAALAQQKQVERIRAESEAQQKQLTAHAP
jgi:hypothetical protein